MKTYTLVVAVAAGLFCTSALHAQTTVTTRNPNGRKTTTTFTPRSTARERAQTANAPVALGPRTTA